MRNAFLPTPAGRQWQPQGQERAGSSNRRSGSRGACRGGGTGMHTAYYSNSQAIGGHAGGEIRVCTRLTTAIVRQ